MGTSSPDLAPTLNRPRPSQATTPLRLDAIFPPPKEEPNRFTTDWPRCMKMALVPLQTSKGLSHSTSSRKRLEWRKLPSHLAGSRAYFPQIESRRQRDSRKNLNNHPSRPPHELHRSH